MTARFATAGSLGAWLLAVASGAAAGGPDVAVGVSPPVASASFDLYCAGCHARGAGAVEAPDLVRLGHKYGNPLPTSTLLERVMPPETRPRRGPTCGDHVVLAEDGQFLTAARRGTVLEILYFLDRVQEPD